MTEAVNEVNPRTIKTIVETYRLQDNTAATSILSEIASFVEGATLQ